MHWIFNLYDFESSCANSDPCAHLGTLWHLFFAENKKILKTAILTLGMNILTVTVVKHDSGMVS